MAEPGYRPRVIVFLRAPRLGAVKTRLAREVGVMRAGHFYRENALATVRRLAADRTFETVLALVPERGRVPDPWPRHLRRITQRGRDLGARMADAIVRAGPGPSLVVGSDISGLNASHIRAALRQLRGADAVIGPAEDGGYWLVGFRHRPLPRGCFAGVRWSGPHARADTLRNLKGMRVAEAATMWDVDDAAGLIRHEAKSRRLRRPCGLRVP